VVKLASTPASAGDQLRDTVAGIDPLASVSNLVDDSGSHLLISLRHALVAGAAAVLLVIGGSLLVAAAEQLRERRRVLAVLAAFGTKRSTLALSILWQTALPVAIGLVLAIILGTALGAILLKVVSLPVAFDWGAVALLVGAGALVIAMVTGLTMPMLWRQMRADALRAE
jgi:ABC-type antimicrobial peptide transport system permease subunit